MRKNDHSSENDVADILLGATAGCLIGAATTLFAPKINGTLLSRVSDLYHHLSGKPQGPTAEAFKRGLDTYTFAKNLASQAKESAADLASSVQNATSLNGEGISSKVLLGALGGGLLSAVAFVYLTSSNKNTAPEFNGHSLGKESLHAGQNFLNSATQSISAINWSDIFARVVETLNEKINHHNDEPYEKPKETKSLQSHAKEIVEWATLGLNLWKNVTTRR